MFKSSNLDIQQLTTRLWVPKFRAITTISAITVTLVFGFLLIAQLHLQTVFGAESLVIADQNLSRNLEISPPRGLFYDRNGEKLVENERIYSLVTSTEISELDYDLAKIILSEEGLSVQLEYSELTNLSSSSVVLASDLSAEQIIFLKSELDSELFSFADQSQRNYLYPKEFSQVIGYTGPVTDIELSEGYSFQDRVGRSGLEQVLESYLQGVKGSEYSLGLSRQITSPEPGKNVFLTIDIDWQRSLLAKLRRQVNLVGARAGAAAIVEVDSGDLLAYASFPTFDPNDFVKGISAKKYERYLEDESKPLVDKVIGLQAPPGSTFKLVTSLANLELGIVDANSRWESTGCMQLGNSEFCEFGKYILGELDIVSAISRSSNTFFCDATLRLVDEHGYDAYAEIATQLSIGIKTGIALPGEVSGLFPTPDYKQQAFSERWFGGDTCNTSIGQGMVLTTPIQMLMMTASLYNGGKVNVPNLISRIESQTGEVEQVDFRQVKSEYDADEGNLKLISNGMTDAVESETGTGYRVLNGVPGNLKVKTGSAEAIEYEGGKLVSRVHGWVVGVFDHSGRKYAFVVHLQYGGGGWNATPVIRDFVNCLKSDFTGKCFK